jgi:predicted ATP-dependent endonuclease of OLD family
MILAVEEPEIYMHPQAQRAIRRVLLNISAKNDQVIFTTHSSLLVDVAGFDEIVRVEATNSGEGQMKTIRTQVWQLPMAKMIKDISARHPKVKVTSESIRELYSHAYHPYRSEAFFAKRAILVEGATEQYCLPIYANALSQPLDRLNISVVDCGGKGQMDRLYRVLNELGIPCYMFFDYDAGSSDPNTIEKSKELLALVGEPTDAPTSILVKDRVCCFPTKWESHLADEIENYSDLQKKAEAALGIKEDTGKPLIARYIAKQLTSKIPIEVPPSIQKVIEQAVRVEWKCSCLSLS